MTCLFNLIFIPKIIMNINKIQSRISTVADTEGLREEEVKKRVRGKREGRVRGNREERVRGKRE